MSDVKPVACINKKLMSRFVGMKTSTKKIFTVDMFEPGDIYLYSQETVTALQAEIEALRKDAERLNWSLPILVGGTDATKRTIILAQEFMNGKDGIEAIDAAIAKEEQP